MPPKKSIEEKAEALKQEGNNAFLSLDYYKAVECYSKAISINFMIENNQLGLRENPVYFNNRSQAYFYSDRLELALIDASKAIELKPDYTKAINNKAQILYVMGKVEEAILLLKTVQEPNADTKKMIQDNQDYKQHKSVIPNEFEASKHKNLFNWLRQGASLFSGVKIEYYGPDYRGIVANKSFQPKECILYIARQNLITLEMSKETTISKKIISSKVDLLSPKHTYLSTFLLLEKRNPESYWKPYLDILPSQYDSFPIFYKPEDLDWLQGSPFLSNSKQNNKEQVREKVSDIHKDYQMISNIAPEFTQFSFEEFCWARMTVSSRIFGISIKGVKTDAFVPLADMLNHRRPKQTSWMYSDEKQGFILEADEFIEKGQTVYESYGRKCNSRFLLNYGFMVEDNDANEIQVTVNVNYTDPLVQQKEDFIQDSIIGSKQFRIIDDLEESTVCEFMSFIRFVVLIDERELKSLVNFHNKFRPTKTPPLNAMNEIQMWQRINLICTQQLFQYRTTFERDQQILKTQQLTHNQRNCLQLRMGEKEILYFFKMMAQDMIELLNQSQKELSKYLQEGKFKYTDYFDFYFLILLSI
ncbi:hypothetical protein pb186bvf_019118 [Paramecium bursaria]